MSGGLAGVGADTCEFDGARGVAAGPGTNGGGKSGAPG